MSKVMLKGKEYTVRPLEFDDVFKLSEILDKIDFDPTVFQTDVQELAFDKKGTVKTEKQMERAGLVIMMKMAGYVLRKSFKARDELRAFFASVIGVKSEQMKHLPLNTPYIIIKALAEENDLLDFFKQATGSNE